MSQPTISRRTVLRGMGTAIALPWLEAMSVPAPLIAGVTHRPGITQPPVRLAFLYVPNGMHMPDWLPQGEPGGEFDLPRTLESLAPLRHKMNLLTGLSLRGAKALGDGGGDHARSVAAFLTGAHPKKTHGTDIRNGISVDQLAAEKIGNLTRLKSLELGTEASSPGGRCDTGYSCLYTSNISWRTETSPLAKEINPAAVFQRLFGSDDEFENRKALSKRQTQNKSVLDFARGEAKTLSQLLGAEDRRKLDEYLYAVRDIERRLKSVDKLEQSSHDYSNFTRPVGVPQQYGEHVTLLLDMMALAFQTDSTRIATFMYANAGSNRSYRNIEVREGHHNISHHGRNREKQDKIAKINRYHVSLASSWLQKLDSIQEGETTLLDNCLIVYGSGIADGNSHAHDDLPIAMFGSGGGQVETGRWLEHKRGTPLTNLYRTMLDKAGAKVDQFSDSTGELEV